MKRIIAIAALIIGASSVVPGQKKRSIKQASPVLSSVEQEVQRVDHLYDQAQYRLDIAGIDHALAADFIAYNDKNETQDRRQYMDDLKASWPGPSDGITVVSHTNSDQRIRVFDDMAIVTGLSKLVLRVARQNSIFRHRYLTVYVKRAGNWQVVTELSTSIPQVTK